MRNRKIFYITFMSIVLSITLSTPLSDIFADSLSNNGTHHYDVEGALYHATDDTKSMGDNGIKKPFEVIEENGKWFLRLQLQSLKPNNQKKKNGLKGYLGSLEYFSECRPNETGKPNPSIPPRQVKVETYHDVYDLYNDPYRGKIKKMRGKLYPQYCRFEITPPQDMKKSRYWVRVFVPLMESLNPGGGNQYARLEVDWSTLKPKALSNDKPDYSRLPSEKPKKPHHKKRPKPHNINDKKNVTRKKKLNIRSLEDGTYGISGEMVKIDKRTSSMSNAAINHTIKLTVKKGEYTIQLRMRGLSVNGQQGYLRQMRYFAGGYRIGAGGAPHGSLKNVQILSYQKKAGKRVSDNYGTDYPQIVSFPLIKEALKDGYVPMQVFVPIMDAIAPGTGTQKVYLKLDLKSVHVADSNSSEFTTEKGSNVVNTGEKDKGSGLGMFKKMKNKKMKMSTSLSGSGNESSRGENGDGASAQNEKKEPPLKKHTFPAGVSVAAFAGMVSTYKKRRKIFKLFIS